MDPTFGGRPGVTSRIRPAPGRRRVWRIDGRRSFPFPVIVDHVFVDPHTREVGWRIEATIGLVDGAPAITRVDARMPGGLDPALMQRQFRWASPLEVVTMTVPILLERGIDPFSFELPVDGFPESAALGAKSNEPLTDVFLEAIAREYLARGRGYAAAMAQERHVSPRTVVSWVEKARRRGILTRVPRGGVGGTIVPRTRRRPD